MRTLLKQVQSFIFNWKCSECGKTIPVAEVKAGCKCPHCGGQVEPA